MRRLRYGCVMEWSKSVCAPLDSLNLSGEKLTDSNLERLWARVRPTTKKGEGDEALMLYFGSVLRRTKGQSESLEKQAHSVAQRQIALPDFNGKVCWIFFYFFGLKSWCARRESNSDLGFRRH